MLWPCAPGAFLTWREPFAAASRLRLPVLLVLLRSRSLWPSVWYGSDGFLVKSESL